MYIENGSDFYLTIKDSSLDILYMDCGQEVIHYHKKRII